MDYFICRFLSSLVESTLSALQQAGCIAVHEEENEVPPSCLSFALKSIGISCILQIVALTLGRIASYYYLDYRTAQQLRMALQSTSSMTDVLQALCDSREFDELPVRHNEDGLNEDLAKTLPLKV